MKDGIYNESQIHQAIRDFEFESLINEIELKTFFSGSQEAFLAKTRSTTVQN